MRANSPPVVSNQHGPHPDLAEVVARHLEHPWRAPLHQPSARVFAAWVAAVAAPGRELILDSGCGTGDSTRLLALQNPEALVLGIDQSEVRLQAEDSDLQQIGAHAWLLRARAETIWRCLLAASFRVSRHCLWYPNPWPKSAHLQRRWHGHPAWPDLLQLSATIELRSNWATYVDEFALALAQSGWQAERDVVAGSEAPVSPFEKKYRESGHALHRLRAQPR
ncbi:SAM-dependent methyltransferase [Ahniella affigens]|uniref:tRNA (guanine(46)-N(7))-methyltransferase n=1 Tax=Ahniella affigens TaxID=2021234 RepID=A0A2P1PQF8_9GAMM|nr:SAM-dependent methyltransferase [Ahniella affigens]AVP97069.1 SAM-dependent methyltransferase [Ahniella affigens]